MPVLAPPAFPGDAYTLHAPDLAVGNVPDAPGWVAGAPPPAVEYADTGQDEADLAVKIRQFFAAGTRLVWVVRLTGARRVEVYRPTAAGEAVAEVRGAGDLLEARHPAQRGAGGGALSRPLRYFLACNICFCRFQKTLAVDPGIPDPRTALAARPVATVFVSVGVAPCLSATGRGASALAGHRACRALPGASRRDLGR
jgi:hypothetical protein